VAIAIPPPCACPSSRVRRRRLRTCSLIFLLPFALTVSAPEEFSIKSFSLTSCTFSNTTLQLAGLRKQDVKPRSERGVAPFCMAFIQIPIPLSFFPWSSRLAPRFCPSPVGQVLCFSIATSAISGTERQARLCGCTCSIVIGRVSADLSPFLLDYPLFSPLRFFLACF